QRVQIDKEVTALQRRIREMVAAAMEAAAAATGGAAQPLTTESEESQETASSSSSTPPQEPEAAAAAPKPTHHVTANPHLNRARARLGRLAKRWQPTEDRDNKGTAISVAVKVLAVHLEVCGSIPPDYVSPNPLRRTVRRPRDCYHSGNPHPSGKFDLRRYRSKRRALMWMTKEMEMKAVVVLRLGRVKRRIWRS
ncbi:hypothetical protein FOZ62_011048, partial [Perkinsus olseni]